MVGLGAGLFGLANSGSLREKGRKPDSQASKSLVVNREPRAVARKNPFA